MISFNNRLAILALVTVLVDGCVIPIPPGARGTRCNLPEGIPDSIKPGLSTREDVLMCLGEPDAVAVDESWVSYSEQYYLGGVVLIFGGGGGVGAIDAGGQKSSRLVVPFDSRGIVTQPIFETMQCVSGGVFVASGGGGGGDHSGPCLNTSGGDLQRRYNLAVPQP